MGKDKRRVVLVGCGMVGMSYAHAMPNQQTCDELVLIGYVKEKAEGEVTDLNHGLAFSGSHMKIWSGIYADCKEVDIVTICAGVAQKPGESRMDLPAWNVATSRSTVEPVTDSGFNGIFLIAANPIDVMTKAICDLSGFDPKHVIGSGTPPNIVRLCYLVSSHLKVDPRSIHGYVMGEHGDSELVPWNQVRIATKPVFDVITESNGAHKKEELEKIEVDVRTAMDKIIAAKKVIYYSIDIAPTRLTKAILGDESSVQTALVYPHGKYKQNGIFVGAPVVISASGVQSVIRYQITGGEQEKPDASCKELKDKVVEAERDLNH